MYLIAPKGTKNNCKYKLFKENNLGFCVLLLYLRC